MAKKTPVIPIFYPPEELFEAVTVFDVYGQPARKSNGRRIVTNRKTDKPMLIKSEDALSYSNQFLKQVPGSVKLDLGGPQDPLLLFAIVYYKSNRPDLSVELIKDLMQEAGVILDDRWIKSELLFSRVDKVNPRTEIVLYRLRKG